jgi:FtsH-binding integral membrane protein
MVVLGCILLFFGVVIGLVGEVMSLAVAYKSSLWWFLGCLFIPIVAWIFLFLYFKAAAKPFGLQIIGLALAGLGGWTAGLIWPG